MSAGNYRIYRRYLSGILGEPPEDLDMSSVAAFRSHYHRKVASTPRTTSPTPPSGWRQSASGTSPCAATR